MNAFAETDNGQSYFLSSFPGPFPEPDPDPAPDPDPVPIPGPGIPRRRSRIPYRTRTGARITDAGHMF
jgi:hypothetical protein